VKIAPDIDSSEWTSLKLDDPRSVDWVRAIEIFKTRIAGWYVDATDLLIETDESKLPTERRFGFVVMAIDCLLIETLAAFREGLTDTQKQSKRIFSNFLATQSLFGNHFTVTRAEQFYSEFRCGILHQAEVGGASRVWSVGEVIRDDSGKLTVNRTEFHKLIKAEIESYAQELENPSDAGLRANFREKMNFICR
jgi:hypothetical protein